MKAALILAKTLLLRLSRDPMTIIVLLAIPVILVVAFGFFLGNTNDISLKVAVVNQSETAFSKEFTQQLGTVKVLKQPDETPATLDDAKTLLRDNKIDAIIELPADFGTTTTGVPRGTVITHFDEADMSTGDIVTGIVGSVVDGTNVAITGSTPPIELKRQAVAVNEEGEGRMFDGLFAMFTAMAIMMVGIFGVASTIPYDKKSGVLRRLSITPLKKGQLAAGIIMTYLVVGIIAVTLMTLIAVFGFNLAMNGSWLDYGLFVIIALIMMMSFGWAIGGIAKNTTQSDIYGQIVFLASLAFSGLWFPRALMPEWMQGITAYLPLTPIIEGIQQIITHGAVITSLGFQLAVIAGWTIIAIIIGIKTFRWE